MFFPLDFLCCFSLSLVPEALELLSLLTAVLEALFPFVGTRFPTDGTRFPFPVEDEPAAGCLFPLEVAGIFLPIEGPLLPFPTYGGFLFPIEGAIFPAEVEAEPRFPMEGFCLPGTLLPMLFPPFPRLA